MNGSLLTWAVHQEGTAREWIREDMDAVLRPFLGGAEKGRPKTGKKKRGSARGSRS
jgi:hypothetical protein